MKLQERLTADLRQALRDKDVPRKEALRMVKAAIRNAEIDLQREASDEEIQAIIAREVKLRSEALEIYRRAEREDLIAEEAAGLTVLREYLPQQMSRDQIGQVVRQIVAELGATGPGQLGPVMRQAMAQLRGRADGRLVNQVAREILAG